MFAEVKYIQNSFAISFERYQTIRRKANEFEDFFREHLGGHYGQPQVIPVPDDLDPEVPRIIFGSKHGFSQIIITQINMALNVAYSPDWQVDISKGQEYLLERSRALYSLIGMLEGRLPFFSGLTTRVQMPVTCSNSDLMHYLATKLGNPLSVESLHDYQIKQTNVLEDKYYNNITIQNYRTWRTEGLPNVTRLPREGAIEFGLSIVGDFNDRFAYNEEREYFSTKETGLDVINKGLDSVVNVVRKIQETNSD